MSLLGAYASLNIPDEIGDILRPGRRRPNLADGGCSIFVAFSGQRRLGGFQPRSAGIYRLDEDLLRIRTRPRGGSMRRSGLLIRARNARAGSGQNMAYVRRPMDRALP